MSGFLNLFELAKDILFPPLCVVCGKINSEYLCNDCALDIRIFGRAICHHCGKPLRIDNAGDHDSDSAVVSFCSLCKNENYYFYRARSFCVYEGAIAKIIHKYKYKRYEYLSKVLVSFLKKAYANYYEGEKIDYIDTVPDYSACYYPMKYSSSRGYLINASHENNMTSKNHMQTLALLFSKLTKIPFADNIIKIKKTFKQQKLDKSLRKVNLSEAFKVKNCLITYGKNFLIIDDVWTTGSTLNEISSVLKKSGANKIFLLTLARPV